MVQVRRSLVKVLAGICITREPISDSSNEKPEVISLGTGTKMLTGENFTASGTALLDCHGEIIARRGFKRFLYDQVKNVNGPNSIFFRPEGSSLLKLKPEVHGQSALLATFLGLPSSEIPGNKIQATIQYTHILFLENALDFGSRIWQDETVRSVYP